jgi:hypothetical protein
MFRGVPITNELIYSILGKPVTDKGKEIGTIIGVNPDKDTISIEIDDWYADEFGKTSGFEIVRMKDD